MAINVFKGSRRISALVGGVWVVGSTFNLATTKPYVSVTYSVATFGARPRWVAGFRCATHDATEDVSRSVPDGDRDVSVTLCFLAAKASNGEMLVPYALGEREGWTLMRDQYSSAVRAYTREIGNGFVLDEAGISEAKRLYATRLRQERIDALKWLFGGLAVGWLVTFLIGWIVRGFMGIPIGLDVKP